MVSNVVDGWLVKGFEVVEAESRAQVAERDLFCLTEGIGTSNHVNKRDL